MKERIERFISKYELCPDNIMYIIRSESKTCIYMTNGQVIETYFSMKKLLAEIDGDGIITINKGIAVSCSQIISVDGCNYTMTDGTVLKGRVRTPGEHKRNGNIAKAMSVYNDVSDESKGSINHANIEEKFSILDDLPLPFAVFHVSCKGDIPIDFVFRYLNRHMAVVAESTVDAVRGRSFYSVFENGDKKWLEIMSEVAFSSESRAIRRFSPEIGRYVSVYLFSPLRGYCACALI